MEFAHKYVRAHTRYERAFKCRQGFRSNAGEKPARKILSSKPADYLAEIAAHAPERLEAQLVPMDRSLWELDRFHDFLSARRRLLADAMNQVLEA